jgi:Zn-dependent protease
MFSFRLGSIPVTVLPSHWLGGALIAAMQLDTTWNSGWPGQVLGNPDAPNRLLTQLAVVLIWVGIVFVSVLFHELGHAVSMRAFRYRPSIQLVALGGYTSPNASAPLPWGRDVVTTFAGPFFGVVLGGVCLVLERFGGGAVLLYILGSASFANFFWAAFNLVPVLPLDGGRISVALLGRAFGKAGRALAYLLGIAVCGVGAYLLWNQGVSLALLFALLFAYQNFQLLMVLWRTEPDSSAPPELLEAESLFGEGKLAEARRRIEALSGRELPRSVAGRLHHLLGWIALREGEGRRALDHFSQVQGRPVERHALAAAFSLIGDEDRALPLWEQAYRETHDPGILQEWAGALLRTGRTAEAEQLPGVDLAAAYGAAEKMAFLRGAYSEAVRFGEEGFRRRPTATGAYDLACALARAGDTRRAVDSLERARELGYTDVEAAATDPDLASLHGMSSFEAWLNSLRKNAGP